MSENIINLFSIPIYQSFITSDNNDEIRNFLYACQGSTNAIFKSDNSFIGYEDNFKILDESKMHFIKQQVLDKFFHYLDTYGIEKKFWYIGKSWITITNPGGSIKMHNHTKHGAIFSGVLYVDVQSTSGDLIFLNPYPFRDRMPFVEKNDLNVTFARFMPEENKILIWPASLNHGTDINLSNTPRLSISFDFHYIDKECIPPINLYESQ